MAVPSIRLLGRALPAALWGGPLLALVLAGGYAAGRIAGPVAPGMHRTGQEPGVTHTTPAPSGPGGPGAAPGMPMGGMEGLARPDGAVGSLR
jgi:hypothetical protein